MRILVCHHIKSRAHVYCSILLREFGLGNKEAQVYNDINSMLMSRTYLQLLFIFEKSFSASI